MQGSSSMSVSSSKYNWVKQEEEKKMLTNQQNHLTLLLLNYQHFVCERRISMVERFEKFSFAMFEISRCWHKIAGEELEKYGIKGSYATYFTVMYRYKEGMTAAQLVELCGRDKADVSRAISLLEKQGLVIRKPNGGNRYRAKLSLTQAGKELSTYIMRRIAVAVELAGKGMNEEQRANFYHCLELITANAQLISKNGLPKEDRKAHVEADISLHETERKG